MAQLTKQDVQSMLDTLKSRIFERVATRQDVQTLTEAARDRTMTYVHDLVQIHQQNIMRRTDVQNSQLTKRIAVLEARLMTMEQELKASRQSLERAAAKPAQSQAFAQPTSSVSPEQLYTRLSYNPE